MHLVFKETNKRKSKKQSVSVPWAVFVNSCETGETAQASFNVCFVWALPAIILEYTFESSLIGFRLNIS